MNSEAKEFSQIKDRFSFENDDAERETGETLKPKKIEIVLKGAKKKEQQPHLRPNLHISTSSSPDTKRHRRQKTQRGTSQND